MTTKIKNKEITVKFSDKVCENLKIVLEQEQKARIVLSEAETEVNKTSAETARLLESVVLMGTKKSIDGLVVTRLNLDDNTITLDAPVDEVEEVKG